jgi:hypothetical protein
VEESDCARFNVLSQHLRGDAEEKHVNSQPG